MKARSNTRLAVAALLIALVAMSVVLPAAAQAPRPMRHTSQSRAQASGVPTPERIEQIATDSVRRPGGLIQVIVTLASRPAVDQYIAAGGRQARSMALEAAASVEAALAAEQAAFANAAASVGATVVNTHTFLTNTVTLTVHPSQLAALWRLPGVVNISPDRIYDRADTTSVPLIRAPEVWASATGATGAGVKIGIIDTGIDYTHSHFGGTGDYNDAGDTTNPTDGAAGLFPAAAPTTPGAPKVIGGYDFVGDDYDANVVGSLPAPDPDPVDCPVADGGGHGSHVAGSAAGWGVNADGTTYAGALNPTIYTSLPNVTTSFLIGPGVAPEASLVALRIFGCDGSVNTDVLLDAIESAVTGDFPGNAGDVAGGLDVINMSLGSSNGGAYDDDPLVDAQEAATDAGLIIVDSAGNTGNITLISGAPGSANSVISVASSTDTTSVGDATLLRNNGTGSPVRYAAQPGAAHNANAVPFTGNIVIANPPEACSPLTNAAAIAGNIALIIRGNPAVGPACPLGFADKQNNAFAAGASGVIVYNHATGGNELISMSNVGVVAAYDLPTYFIGNTAGLDLVAQVGALGSGNVSVTFDFGDPNVYGPETADQISSFSSRGGVVRGIGDMTLKPNVAAPGNTIVSARSGAGDAFYVISGTSMASPHVAGVAALMRELHPTYTVAQIKALIMNTANADVANAAIHPPQRVGSGRVDVVDAAASDVIAYWTDNRENVSVSFGYPKVLPGAPSVFTETVTIRNLGTTARAFTAAYEAISDMPGVTVTVDAGANLAASGTATITVTLTVDPSVAEPNVITYAFDTSTANTTFLTEEAGNIVLTADGLPELRVPVYAAPHVASAMSGVLSLNSVYTGAGIELNGIGVDTNGDTTTNTATTIVSQVAAFELVADDGVDANLGSFQPRPGDDYAQDDNAVDIDKVGISTDAPSYISVSLDPVDNGTAFVGISTFSEWNRPTDSIYQIYVDVDFDGAEDWIIYNGNGGTTQNVYEILVVDVNAWLGAVPGAAYTLTNPKPFLNWFAGANTDTMLFKNNVIVLPVPLWLTNDATFEYWIESLSRDGDFEVVSDTVASSAAPLFYDATNPSLYFNDLAGTEDGPYAGLPMWYDLDGYAIPVDVNPTADLETVPDILLFHFHNQDPATRAQVLDSSILATSLGGFDLLTPANNSVVLDPASLTSVTWEHVEGTDVEWRFVLTQISTNTRLGQVVDLPGLTPEADLDALTCAAGVCSLSTSGLPALTDGLYSWTATYTDGLGNEQEATNAPFFFTIETNDYNLLQNPGFEDCTAKDPANWNGLAVCQLAPAKANSGNGVLVAAVGRYAVQKITSANSSVLAAQGAGDVLNFSGYFKGKAVANQVAVVTVKYASGPAGKIKVKLTANTTGFELFDDSITLTGTPVFVKVKVGSSTGKVFVDDLSLTTTGINGPETRAAGDLLPPPAAPDGFRGNN